MSEQSAEDRCASYNWELGGLPQILVPKPAWSDRNGDTIALDHCLATTVQALWEAGYITLSSCCGHGKNAPSLVLEGGVGPEVVASIRRLIADVDGREFRLYQWQIVEV